MKQHLQRYIGWYFLGVSILLIVGGEGFTGFLVGLVTLLKVPPFDWVGRGFDWDGRVGTSWGLKLKDWKEQQTRPIRVLITIIAILLIILIFWFMPECELC